MYIYNRLFLSTALNLRSNLTLKTFKANADIKLRLLTCFTFLFRRPYHIISVNISCHHLIRSKVLTGNIRRQMNSVKNWTLEGYTCLAWNLVQSTLIDGKYRNFKFFECDNLNYFYKTWYIFWCTLSFTADWPLTSV